MKFRPRLLPRDLLDLAAFISVGFAQLTALLVIPYFLFLFLTKSPLVALLAPISLYGLFALYSVRFILVDATGIKFARILGKPKLLTWSEIKEVSLVSRGELIVHGWLWPLLPAREMTPCLSSQGHYRISWGKDCCYYPPADVELFKSVVAEHLKQGHRDHH
jgi:hypothetical protein